MKVSRSVLGISMVIAVVFILWGIVLPKNMSSITSQIQQFIQHKFGWFYLLAASAFLVFSIFLVFSKYGNIRLGKDDEKPEYSFITWFAMLFSAGMGIGLVFWGVAEPLSHFASPPVGEGGTTGAAREALKDTLFHWGLHPWAIYTLIGLSLAYFKFRKNAPGLISATFYPILGEKVKGPIGKTIDILAVFATLFGVATSLGFGAAQISGGLSSLIPNIPNNFTTQLIIIAIVTILFISSALSGLDKGIKYLSNGNIALAVLLMLVLLFIGPTEFIANSFTTMLGDYIQRLPAMSLQMSPFTESQQAQWTQAWTIFYWAWWISWAPFVGTFIARVSRGRTVREFILGVLLVPTIFSAIWFAIMGGSGIYQEIFSKAGIVNVINKQGTEIALFKFLEAFPLGSILSVLAILLIATFFITSADSATFVLGMQVTHGSLNPSKTIRVIWGLILSVSAAVLLGTGGLQGLQTASIISAFPFALVLILMMVSLVKALNKEKIVKIVSKPSRAN
ncbi:glycine betaine uptake BCCT transporter [Thermoflavimicrobium daqui]|jgi:glycine betaine transporter|uniref:Glycine/betaine ABC transporter permease n=1 Tax=Thermoflavimicrobium daqui TaxID=2137476 RepID=A0A364K0W9_9BACL|nr:BCCT family transporter [Thermoflavimicrobium daqui]RAL21339.1 glycine/betaine ABC transporter permease [Thermoflavimicrobium daqui]